MAWSRSIVGPMFAELWKRPSIVVVGTAVTVVAVFVARGDLSLTSREQKAPPASKPVQVAAANGGSGAERAPVVVKPERAGRVRPESPRTVRGRVFDAMGFLVVGAEVVAAGQSILRTDSDGVFSAQLATATTPLLVRASGYRSQWVVPSVGSPDGLLVQLEPAAPWDEALVEPHPVASNLTGEGLVRGFDGKPLAGAYVTAVGSLVWSRTDEIGRYTLPLPTSSTTTLVVHHPDGAGDGRGQVVRSEPVQFERKSGVVPLPELVASLGSALRGTLRDGQGNPVSGVPLQVRGEGLSRVIESGISGMFRLAGLLPGRYEIQPIGYRGALGQKQEIVVDHAFVDCVVQLHPTAEQRVQVLDERGEPMRRAYVATSFDGERRSVAQADGEGWASVRIAAKDAQFEVRGADHYEAMSVRRYEADHNRLVVAAP
jgi:hypothetical protein